MTARRDRLDWDDELAEEARLQAEQQASEQQKSPSTALLVQEEDGALTQRS